MPRQHRKKVQSPKGRTQPPPAKRRPKQKPDNQSPSAPYRCSKCGFGEGLDDPDWSDPRTDLSANDLGNPKCYQLCPNEGPRSGYLTDEDRLHMRYRQVFLATTDEVRACIPFGVVDRYPEGGVQLGMVADYEAVHREIYLRDYLSEHGLDSDIDIRHAHQSSFLGDRWSVHKSGTTWTLPPQSRRVYLDGPYQRDLFAFCNRHPDSRELHSEVMAALDSRHGDDPNFSDHVLSVPIDLRSPIDKQLSDAGAFLKNIREYLYRFVKDGPPRKRDNLARDTYIYLLREVEDLSAADIAARTFPRETKKSRVRKVHLILQQVRSALAKTPHRTLVKIEP